MMPRFRFALSAAIVYMFLAQSHATAQGAPDQVPAELEGIDLVDRSGETVPADIALIDESGQTVRLGAFFNHEQPILIQLVYYSCPMLCTQVLNGYLAAAKKLDWIPGRDYTVVTVSFDPRDTAALAAGKKATHVAELGKPEAAAGWHFLVGDSTETRRLADALGFSYRYDPIGKIYAHPAGMFVLTPEGTISRTLYGIEFSPKDLRLSLTEASQGRLGTPLDKFLMYCYQYDPKTHKYALVAMNVMKAGGLVTLIVLGALLGALWARERRRHHPATASGIQA